eukprot:jgi/Undpi1/7907/HiC_scaffold_24.g10379.m1
MRSPTVHHLLGATLRFEVRYGQCVIAEALAGVAEDDVAAFVEAIVRGNVDVLRCKDIPVLLPDAHDLRINKGAVIIRNALKREYDLSKEAKEKEWAQERLQDTRHREYMAEKECAERGAVAMETVAICGGKIDTIVGGKVVTVVMRLEEDVQVAREAAVWLVRRVGSLPTPRSFLNLGLCLLSAMRSPTVHHLLGATWHFKVRYGQCVIAEALAGVAEEDVAAFVEAIVRGNVDVLRCKDIPVLLPDAHDLRTNNGAVIIRNALKRECDLSDEAQVVNKTKDLPVPTPLDDEDYDDIFIAERPASLPALLTRPSNQESIAEHASENGSNRSGDDTPEGKESASLFPSTRESETPAGKAPPSDFPCLEAPPPLAVKIFPPPSSSDEDAASTPPLTPPRTSPTALSNKTPAVEPPPLDLKVPTPPPPPPRTYSTNPLKGMFNTPLDKPCVVFVVNDILCSERVMNDRRKAKKVLMELEKGCMQAETLKWIIRGLRSPRGKREMAQRLHGLEFAGPQWGVPKYKTGKGLRHLLKGIETRNGTLIISTANKKVEFKYYDTPKKKYKDMKKSYVSGMLQTWNKFCFTGGIVEIRARLPGKATVGGLWPAMWLMGNLARATFTSSSDFLWPWSYSKCNRTTEQQAEWQRQQEISACDTSVHYGLHPNVGRGAPEIDILEAMAGTLPGVRSWMFYPVSPGTSVENRPTEGKTPLPGTWYEKGMYYGENTTLNKCYYADAVSANSLLSATHFEDIHTYRLDWQPGEDGRKGYLRWLLDDVQLYGIDDDTLSLHGAQIPLEPVYLLLNTAVSDTWGFPVCPMSCDCDCFDASDPACECAVDPGFPDMLPAEFIVDSVRVYQAKNDSSHTLGCDTKEYPTRDFIKAHEHRYMDQDGERPMLPVQTGGGSCRGREDCNGEECDRRKRCKCGEGWTGPHCRAAAAGDDGERRLVRLGFAKPQSQSQSVDGRIFAPTVMGIGIGRPDDPL